MHAALNAMIAEKHSPLSEGLHLKGCAVRLISALMQITIYHAPKTKELQLQGMEGSVKNIVKKYKGKETSANLPYRIEFLLEKDDGKQQKFFAHLVGTS